MSDSFHCQVRQVRASSGSWSSPCRGSLCRASIQPEGCLLARTMTLFAGCAAHLKPCPYTRTLRVVDLLDFMRPLSRGVRDFGTNTTKNEDNTGALLRSVGVEFSYENWPWCMMILKDPRHQTGGRRMRMERRIPKWTEL